MNEMQREFLDILADVRAHLEYQKALGIRTIEMLQGERPEPLRTVSLPENPTVSPVLKEGPQIPLNSPSSKGGEGGIAIPAKTLAGVREELGDCMRCKLYRGRKTIVFGEGNPNAALVFVGEGPGFEEDEQGRPFVGEAGQLLTKIIEHGMKLRREDVYICNVVKCRPPNNRNPEPDEIASCGPFLLKQLETIKPKVIVTLGNIPTQTLLKTKEGITRLRGKWQTYQGIPLMPTFHPAYLLRNPKDKKLVWDDIRQVMKEMEKPGKG